MIADIFIANALSFKDISRMYRGNEGYRKALRQLSEHIEMIYAKMERIGFRVIDVYRVKNIHFRRIR